VIDHFQLSEQLFSTSVKRVSTVYESDNTSDDDPLSLHLDVSIAKFKCNKKVFTVRPSRDKANALHTEQYKTVLRNNLSRITILKAVCLCENRLCRCEEHVTSLNHYAAQITEACHKSAKDAIPMTKNAVTRVAYPGPQNLLPLSGLSPFSGIICGLIAVSPIMV